MAKVVVLERKEYDRLREIIGDPIVVVVEKSIADQIGEEKLEEMAEDYDCGGEAETWVDFVSHNGHHFFRDIMREGKHYAIG